MSDGDSIVGGEMLVEATSSSQEPTWEGIRMLKEASKYMLLVTTVTFMLILLPKNVLLTLMLYLSTNVPPTRFISIGLVDILLSSSSITTIIQFVTLIASITLGIVALGYSYESAIVFDRLSRKLSLGKIGLKLVVFGVVLTGLSLILSTIIAYPVGLHLNPIHESPIGLFIAIIKILLGTYFNEIATISAILGLAGVSLILIGAIAWSIMLIRLGRFDPRLRTISLAAKIIVLDISLAVTLFIVPFMLSLDVPRRIYLFAYLVFVNYIHAIATSMIYASTKQTLLDREFVWSKEARYQVPIKMETSQEITDVEGSHDGGESKCK